MAFKGSLRDGTRRVVRVDIIRLKLVVETDRRNDRQEILLDDATMEIAEMVLGKVNKSLVTMVQELGVKAVGVSGKDGGLLKVDRKRSADSHHTDSYRHLPAADRVAGSPPPLRYIRSTAFFPDRSPSIPLHWVEKVGMEARFVNGLRVTDDATMEIAEMVLGKGNDRQEILLDQVKQHLGIDLADIPHKADVLPVRVLSVHLQSS